MTTVLVTDLCGRFEPYQTDLDGLKEAPVFCRDDDIDHILDMFADGQTAFVGEIEYREVATP